MRKDSLYRILYALYQVGIPAVSICKLVRGRGQTSHFIPFAPRVPALEGVKCSTIRVSANFPLL